MNVGGFMHPFQIAIDGPAGSGKSSISKALAEHIGYIHLDTGAMYRAVTLLALEKHVILDDPKSYVFLETTKFDYKNERMFIGDRDVTEAIRSAEVTENVSLVSSIPYVRQMMVKQQQDIASNKNLIMDGRDIGSVVLPKAPLKIFLTAAIEERAKRRIAELHDDIPLEEMIEDIKIRDHKDSTRTMSPLTKASDAIIIDTTYLTHQEVVDAILVEINKRTKDYARY